MTIWIHYKATASERQRKRPDKVNKKNAAPMYGKTAPYSRFNASGKKYTPNHVERQNEAENGTEGRDIGHDGEGAGIG